MNIDRTWGSLASGNWCRLTKSSENTPNFKLYKLARIPLPPHPYKRTYESRYSQIVDTYNGLRNEWDAQGAMCNIGNITGGITTLIEPYAILSKGTDELARRCSNKLSKKLYSRPVDLSIAFGERKETAKLLADSAKRLGRTFLHLRKGNFAGAARQLFGTYDRKLKKQLLHVTDPAKAWLCMQYGVKPLLSDIYGSIEAIQKVRPPQLVLRASCDEVYDYAGSSGVSPNNRDITISGYNSVKMSLHADVSNPYTNAIADLGLTNPIATAWELLPFSFVVDYFVLVGDWLQSVQSPPGLSNFVTYTTLGGDLRVTSNTNFSYGIGWHTRGEYKATLRQRDFYYSTPTVYVNSLDRSRAFDLIPSALAFLQIQSSAFFNKEYLQKTRPVRF